MSWKLYITFLASISTAYSQFITPSWRGGTNSEYSEWDVFTNADIGDGVNSPDLAQDTPTNDATILSSTTSAFLTSAGNIYSFLDPIACQLDDSTNFQTENIFLQINSLGSTLDLDSVRLIPPNATGPDDLITPTRAFIIDQGSLTGEFGGLGTSYAIQWDLSANPLIGSYTILFEASSSSMSLNDVSLDTSDTYIEVPIPTSPLPNPSIVITGTNIKISWPVTGSENAFLESNPTNV